MASFPWPTPAADDLCWCQIGLAKLLSCHRFVSCTTPTTQELETNMLRVLAHFFLHSFLTLGMAHAQSVQEQPTDSDKKIELLCKLDTGAEVRYTVDLARELLYPTVMLEMGRGGGCQYLFRIERYGMS